MGLTGGGFTPAKLGIVSADGQDITNANPFPISQVVSASKIFNIEFQTITTVASGTETTVLSFTNTGSVLFIDSIGGTGTARSEWKIYFNSIEKIRRRIEVGNMNLEIPMYDFKLGNGSTIDVKIEHPETNTQSFQSDVRYWR